MHLRSPTAPSMAAPFTRGLPGSGAAERQRATDLANLPQTSGQARTSDRPATPPPDSGQQGTVTSTIVINRPGPWRARHPQPAGATAPRHHDEAAGSRCRGYSAQHARDTPTCAWVYCRGASFVRILPASSHAAWGVHGSEREGVATRRRHRQTAVARWPGGMGCWRCAAQAARRCELDGRGERRGVVDRRPRCGPGTAPGLRHRLRLSVTARSAGRGQFAGAGPLLWVARQRRADHLVQARR
jgi:hypothetical protein